MKTLLPLICFLCCMFSMPPMANSSPDSPNNYTDFLPKYRSQNQNFILTKIVYTSEKMIIHFQYVAKDDQEMIRFSGSATPSAWQLYTSARGSNGMTKHASLQNIKINNRLKAEKIASGNEAEFMAKHGEVVEGEAHFSKLPSTIRSVHFSGGEIANCNDILIKASSNPLLRSEEQMKGSVNRFYNMLSHFGTNVIVPSNAAPKEENTLSGIDFGSKKAEPVLTKKEKQLAQAAKPVKYTPRELVSAKDMGCNTRVILKNVYFADNSAEYAGRVEALKTIQIVYEYLKYYPQATIILHGHTDVFGNAVRNDELSRQRVLTVKRTLVGMGVDSERISLLHHGSAQPLPSYTSGGKKNRRVEVEAICEK